MSPPDFADTLPCDDPQPVMFNRRVTDNEPPPLDSLHPSKCLRDAELKVLLQHHTLLARQIAELAIGQQSLNSQMIVDTKRLKTLESDLAENTIITVEVRDLLGAIKGGMKVLGWLGTFAKWAGGIAAALAAIYTAVYMIAHGGKSP